MTAQGNAFTSEVLIKFIQPSGSHLLPLSFPLKNGERTHNYFMNRTGYCWSHSVVCRGLKVIQGNNGTQIAADIKGLSQI